MNQLRKSLYTLYFSFGIYGFSREFRSVKNDYPNRLYTDKFFCSTINGIMYLIPPYNIYYLAKLFNRLEIQNKSLNKLDYRDQYTEVFGNKCDSTW